jgi:hypothetical protein
MTRAGGGGVGRWDAHRLHWARRERRKGRTQGEGGATGLPVRQRLPPPQRSACPCANGFFDCSLWERLSFPMTHSSALPKLLCRKIALLSPRSLSHGVDVGLPRVWPGFIVVSHAFPQVETPQVSALHHRSEQLRSNNAIFHADSTGRLQRRA